jgi:ATP-binding cassette subfamily F protein uup
MKLLDGTMLPDTGEIVRQGGVTVARLEQDIPDGVHGTIYDVVAEGLGEDGRLLARYHEASLTVGVDASEANLKTLDRLHHAVDSANGWRLHTRVETVLEHLGLEADAQFEKASGGRKRQTLLARALVRQPDVLLLDEPTNHLDIDAIEWMEAYLIEQGITLLFVTHDRAFLRRLATRILELDRGKLVDWGTDYDTYLQRKDAALDSEQKAWDEFDRKLAIEEKWIRTGIRARRTRNEGRVRALEAMRRDRQARRERVGTVRLAAQEAERSGRLVIEARDVSFAHGERPIVRDLSTTIMRGDRVGLIGPNGSGKTTLLRLLLGELPPASGTVRHGTGLEVAYFDQLRDTLDPERSVFDSIADGAEWVQLTTGRQHVHGYLQDFLFPPDRARTPVRALSGGGAQPLAAGAPLHAVVQRPRPRRADERSRHRDARPARGPAHRVQWDAAGGESRPRLPRSRRHQHAGDGGEGTGGRVRRRLQRLGAPAPGPRDNAHAKSRRTAHGCSVSHKPPRRQAAQALLQGAEGTRGPAGAH